MNDRMNRCNAHAQRNSQVQPANRNRGSVRRYKALAYRHNFNLAAMAQNVFAARGFFAHASASSIPQ